MRSALLISATRGQARRGLGLGLREADPRRTERARRRRAGHALEHRANLLRGLRLQHALRGRRRALPAVEPRTGDIGDREPRERVIVQERLQVLRQLRTVRALAQDVGRGVGHVARRGDGARVELEQSARARLGLGERGQPVLIEALPPGEQPHQDERCAEHRQKGRACVLEF